MSERKYFGTDGVRGTVGEYPITADFALKLGWAVGKVLGNEHGGKVLIGKDTRISGYMFESALEAGLIAAGVDVLQLGPMPTPGIAYLTRTFRADAGIVISASHNPFNDNGIKFFSKDGFKLPDSVELEIEAMLDQPMQTVSSAELGKARRVEDARGRYIEFCKASIASSFDFSNLKVVLDCAHGATYHIAPEVFSELGAEVVTIGDKPNGLNINEGCGATNTSKLAETVLAEKANIGIAFDGDGDRVMMVDEKGEQVDGDQLLFIIARDAKKRGLLDGGGIVGTLMTNLGMEKALEKLEIPFVRAKVGDRYVMEQLSKNNWLYGGESSGHIICLNVTTTGDGVVAALQVLSVMARLGLSLHELKSGMTKFPQNMINVRLPSKNSKPLDNDVVKAEVKEVEQQLADKGRVLLRASGTEPLIRVMVEGEDAALVKQCSQHLAEVVKNNC
ncbi:phosphoglucosamine mutase [Pleionea mediterranea]|uniref:Phosphoglucosamine mutase n=1 Tax=Pleionea mediterranea TaxID=523701 RepID=A0A316G2A8_9GAMM|nr:phosphoglucosamine mutase [Pleionea mediterranea]PWK48517.1 phosphoglucosamine mutase [Pleionea mediterranea]